MPSACAFCEILFEERDVFPVLEDAVSIAFLDHRPLFPGHCLLVPREHYATLSDLPPDLVGPLFLSARTLARAVEAAMNAEGSFVAMNNRVSQSVAHLHVHVVPRHQGDGLRGFFWPRQSYANIEAMRDVQANIQTAVALLRSEQQP